MASKSKGNKLEATLVSMAGTLIYLHDLAATLSAKPIIPRAVESFMGGTQTELTTLSEQFERTVQAARKESEPFVEEWLTQRGLSIGGGIRGCTVRRRYGGTGAALTFEGGIEHARLYHFNVDAVRVIDFTLVGARIGLEDGSTVSCVDGIPMRDQGKYNLTAFKDFITKDPVTGEPVRKLHVRVPIQEIQRGKWSRDGDLELK